uniref:Uncharacterized protein n=1 Tax=Lactuca sativa TaxID=4236 RepID=A0A9R1XTH8_LACSA|nr:hypothetical protein LSAT_V11C100007700 [Lactuca sativa]
MTVSRREELKKSLVAKLALRQSNLNPERPTSVPCKHWTLASNQINEEQRESLMDELKNVNLSKFVSEAMAAICDAKLKSSDIQAAVQDLASLEHLKDRDTSHKKRSLLASFARHARYFIGLSHVGEELVEEFFKGLNITSDQKKVFKKAFHTYHDAAVELLRSEHTGVDLSIGPEVWEFILGCYSLSSTTDYRRRLRIARRRFDIKWTAPKSMVYIGMLFSWFAWLSQDLGA